MLRSVPHSVATIPSWQSLESLWDPVIAAWYVITSRWMPEKRRSSVLAVCLGECRLSSSEFALVAPCHLVMVWLLGMPCCNEPPNTPACIFQCVINLAVGVTNATTDANVHKQLKQHESTHCGFCDSPRLRSHHKGQTLMDESNF